MTTLSAMLVFQISYARSLKDKRQVSQRLIQRTRQRFNAAVAEVAAQEAHQTLTLGVAVVSSQAAHARAMLDEIVRFMENNTDAELVSVQYPDM